VAFLAKVVDHPNLVTPLNELTRDLAAYEPGAPGYDHSHIYGIGLPNGWTILGSIGAWL
jgi:hypothetical protein